MKKTQEFDGKNLDQAIENACRALKVTKKNLHYDVISAGSTGIFGIVGVKKARILVTLPQGNDNNEEASDDDDVAGIMSIVDEAFGETTPTEEKKKSSKKQEAGAKPKRKPGPNKKADSSKNDTRINGSATKSAAKPETKPAVKPENKSKPEPSRKAKDKKVQVEPEIKPKPDIDTASDVDAGSRWDDLPEAPSDDETVQKEKKHNPVDDRDYGYPPIYDGEIPVDVSEDSKELGRGTLQSMVDLITDGADVVAETDQDRLLLKVEGGNSGVLIGRRGQTLEAMQFLTDKIINRKSDSRVRLKVDIEGYMEARKSNLIGLAHKMAEKAKKTGKPATINQMTAQDRRTVHLALKDDARVRTQSMGDGYYRRLVIFPKKGSYKKRSNFRQ